MSPDRSSSSMAAPRLRRTNTTELSETSSAIALLVSDNSASAGVVHAVQHVGVLLLHGSAPDLQGRRDLTLLNAQLRRQDFEPLDGLPALKGLVSLRDLTLNQVMNLT